MSWNLIYGPNFNLENCSSKVSRFQIHSSSFFDNRCSLKPQKTQGGERRNLKLLGVNWTRWGVSWPSSTPSHNFTKFFTCIFFLLSDFRVLNPRIIISMMILMTMMVMVGYNKLSRAFIFHNHLFIASRRSEYHAYSKLEHNFLRRRMDGLSCDGMGKDSIRSLHDCDDYKFHGWMNRNMIEVSNIQLQCRIFSSG